MGQPNPGATILETLFGSSDSAGVKRSFELSTSHLPSGEEVWTGATLQNIRKLTLDFATTSLSKDLAYLKARSDNLYYTFLRRKNSYRRF